MTRHAALAAMAGALTTGWTEIGNADAPSPYETVVTAPPAPVEAAREDASASASVITRDRTPRSAETVPQLLAELPGAVVTRYGSHGSLATLSLRGSSPNQVVVYADGVPLDSAVTGAMDLGLLPMGGLDRIEVYRGTSPLAFGSSAIGGVVSLSTEAPRASDLGAHTGAGSFDTRYGGADAAWVGRRVSLLARASLFASRADFPYTSDNRTVFDPTDDRVLRRENNDLQQADATVRADVALGGHRTLGAVVSALDRDQGLPSRGTDESYRTRLRRRRAHGSASYDSHDDLGAGGRLRLTAYGLAAEQRFEDPLAEISFVPTSTRDRSFTGGGTVNASKWLVPWLELSAMLDGRREGFTPHDDLGDDSRPPGGRSFGAAGAGADLWLERLRLDLLAGARLEAADDTISPVAPGIGQPGFANAADYLLPVVRVGVVEHVSPALVVRANAGRYARLPSLAERYGNGGVIRGAPDLRPESGVNADAGIGLDSGSRGRGRRIAIDAALFAARSRDLIHFRDVGYYALYQNVGRARVLGAELAAHLQAWRFAHLQVQGTFTDARDESGASASDGKQLPLQPRLRAYARPELRGLPLGRAVTMGLYADADAMGARHDDPANLVQHPGRVLFGAGGFVAWPALGLRAVVSAYNLADAQVSDVLHFPLPGRSVFVTLHAAYPRNDSQKESLE